MAQYPTKEEILNKPHEVRKINITIVSTWKDNFYKNKWKEADKKKKLMLLVYLLSGFNIMYSNGHPLFAIKKGSQYSYNPAEKEITLDAENPSILSTLHEYAHHLLGSSELEACVWSIRLFEKVFPREFKKLRWEGHILRLAK